MGERKKNIQAIRMQGWLTARFEDAPQTFSASGGRISLRGNWTRIASNDLAFEKAIIFETLGRAGRSLPEDANSHILRNADGEYAIIPMRADTEGRLAGNCAIRMIDHQDAIWFWGGSSARIRGKRHEPSGLPCYATPRDMVIYTASLLANMNENLETAARLTGRYLQGVALWGRPLPSGPLTDVLKVLPQEIPARLALPAAVMHAGLTAISRTNLTAYRRCALLGAMLTLHVRGVKNGEALLTFYEELHAGRVREREYFARMTPGQLAAHLRPADLGADGRRLLGDEDVWE